MLKELEFQINPMTIFQSSLISGIIKLFKDHLLLMPTIRDILDLFSKSFMTMMALVISDYVANNA